ncbi:uncharacterized protein [Panulirus ornatus]|uniref:uncharacterized protein isoform X1 n=1 Tax=Panulirus ornatus TaxID=150431 RepID=UPI003A8510EB
MAGLRLAYCFNSRGGSQQSFILVLFMDQNLGSQLRGASTDARGRSSLHIDSEMCTNKLANADPRKEEADIQKVVKFLFDGRPPPSHKIVAMVEMASHAAMAYLNGVPVELYRSADLRTPAGVVIVVVVHPTTGRALRRYLVASHASARPLRALMASFQHGRLVLIAGTAFEVDPSIRSWLSDLGVTIPWSPTMSRVAWAWVGVVGGSTLGQVGGVLPPGTRRKLHLELYLPRVPDTPWCAGAPRPASEDDTRWAARVELCSLYDGYGEWCSCPPTTGIEPWPGQESAPAFTVKGTTTPDLTDVVTLALATRPDALHRLLVSLAAAAGGKNVSIVVFTNEPSHELTKVCESHGVQLEATGRASDCLGLHVSRLYESALRATLILKPRASFIITLEDDMEVFPTFYRWMSAGRRAVGGSQRWVCVNSIHGDYQPPALLPPADPLLLRRHDLTEKLGSAKPLVIWPGLARSGRSSGGVDEATDARHEPADLSQTGSEDDRHRTTGNVADHGGNPLGKPGEGRREGLGVGRRENVPEDPEPLETGEVAEEMVGWRYVAGWGAERSLVEAMIRFWPLATRDVDWETLLEYWAGSAPCLTPKRPHARHARASQSAPGFDLMPPV